MEKYFEAVERLKNIQKSTQQLRLLLYRLRPVIKARKITVRADHDSIDFIFLEREHVDELAAQIPVKVEMYFRGHSSQLQQHAGIETAAESDQQLLLRIQRAGSAQRMIKTGFE